MEKQKKLKFFTDQEKLQIVTEVMEGRITKEEARYKYDIPGNCSVLYWMRKFSGITNYRQQPIKEVILDVSNIERQKELEALKVQIEMLKKQLSYEQLRADTFDTMITIAEQEFSINIRKKSGAKQPRKSDPRTKK